MTDVKRIESYGLFDFCQDIEAAHKEGYVFDFDTNENFPTAYGSMFTCGLVKAGKEVEETKESTEVETEAKTEETTDEVKTEVEETAAVTAVTSVVEEVVTEVEEVTQETSEVKEPAKRGPKPKNK